MLFLPIAHRELRVSARSKATSRLRLLFAMAALAVAGAMWCFSTASRGFLTPQLGSWLFGALKWIAFIFACIAGTFLTADCLSEEKREGTLGLLFLTDLHGADVVFGKLFATSVRTFYALLAIFPVMALSFILGGVDIEDFRHALLAICNALFFSLALGMVISVISRDPHKAMTSTLLATTAIVLGLPGIVEMATHSMRPGWASLSPLFSVVNTLHSQSSEFWWSIAVVHGMGWGLLALASWLAPKTWQETGAVGLSSKLARIPLPGFRGKKFERGAWLEKSPVAWIIARDRWGGNISRWAMILAIALLLVSIVIYSVNPPSQTASGGRTFARTSTTVSSNGTTTTSSSSSATVVWSSGISAQPLFYILSFVAGALPIALDFWLAAQVSRFYVDGKRSGFLELLMVTPVRPRDIIAAHWLALRRLFLAPVLALVALMLTLGIIGVFSVISSVPAGIAQFDMIVAQSISLVMGTANWCLGLYALVWFSIWMGVKSRKLNVAMLKTFSFVKIIPWFVVQFGAVMIFMAAMRGASNSAFWIYPTLQQGMLLCANLLLIFLARENSRLALPEWAASPTI